MAQQAEAISTFDPVAELSKRERELLQLREQGKSIIQIAAAANLPENSITKAFSALRARGIEVPESKATSAASFHARGLVEKRSQASTLASPSPATSVPETVAIGEWKWTGERVEQLQKLYADGLSASRIATEIGAPTRNTIIGKVARLGLQRAKKVAARHALKKAARPAPAPTPEAARNAQAPAQAAPAGARQAPVRPDAPEPLDIPNTVDASTRAGDAPPTAVTIHELRSDRCHWPFGDPRDEAFRYCGARVPSDVIERGRCYCAMHMKAAAAPGGRGRTAS